MGNALNKSERFRHIDMLIPLPLFAERLKKRGYNQSAVLCSGMAGGMQVAGDTSTVMGLSATQTQTQKSLI